MVKRPAAVSEHDSDSDQVPKRARTNEASDDEEEAPRRTQRKANGKGKGKARATQDDDDLEEAVQVEDDDGERVDSYIIEEDDETFEQKHTDAVREQIANPKRKKKGMAEYGVIEAIEVTDFMCHNHLQFEFGPQINFIIGGKSAVLSALTIALGGKSTSTGRGSGLKSFIREGKDTATVTMKIKNQGPEAYKHDVYGDSIIVKRIFKKDGAASWKICDSKLNKPICDHMNIQVDNPLNVLTQDSARMFLSASTPGDKYKFFLLGTQLFQLSQQYEQWSSKQKVEDLKKELAWSHVAGKKREMEAKAMDVENSEQKLKAAKKEVEEETFRIQELEVESTELGNVDDIQTRRNKLMAEMRDNKAKILQHNGDLREMNQTKARIEKTIEGFDAEIDRENKRLAAHSQARHDELKARIDNLTAQITAHETQLKAINAQKAEIQSRADDARRRGMELEKSQAEVKNKIEQIQGTIGQAKQVASDQYVPYGNRIQDVLKKISQTRWHGEPPVGPLGLYVKAKDPKKWGDILRVQLAGLLTAFAVTDARDRPVLKKILSEYRNNNLIIIGEKDIFDYSQGEPPERYHTVLRALDINDPWVTRILINQASVERVLLARDRKEVEIKCLELGSAMGWADGFNVRTFNGTGVQSTPVRGGGGNPLLLTGRDNASQVRHLEEQKADLERQYHDLGRQIQATKDEYARARNELGGASKPEANIVTSIRGLKTQLQFAQQEVNDDLPSQVSELVDAKQESEDELKNLLAQFTDVARRKAELDQIQGSLQPQVDQLKRELDDFQQKMNEVTTRIADAAGVRTQKQHNVKHFEERIKAETVKLKVEQDKSAVLEEEFANWTASALEYCPEVPNPRATEKVQSKLNSVQEALKMREKRGGRSVEDLAVEVNKTKEAYTKVNKDYKQASDLNKALKASLQVRLYRWQEFRRHIALRTKLIFQYHLSQRGYFGKVMFDHQAQTLQLKVITDDQAAGGSGAEKDPRSLSGGEKSFSTICLLLSLWDSIGCPLRCLDEFDVFMDAVNRRISMKMMIDTANASPDKQYILITPQDMTNITIGDTVKVHRMLDPERSSGRLRFGAGPSNDS
ncbi:hypothetical protein BKA70DRAFT_1338202 [Coprinopsis sp. MPI-PUGE-AT-0042]|nr:hypothetical protein BKA70DRAFT_1338202 [Coprinopsis sp. MPI-PUGE-AT-0042]